ncbi:IS110 family transposase (plasmid) [Gemmobacter fulvus]|uniref:IS110 family transposase n=1 Tax=Gemmobacter fulvus TaxID=2840474 RepID=A0A975P9S3_9RHOB|nr:IS110 family transposase [Gemmobacter fulvus]QWK92130.1 IS110 family transposase [Gemmobacter fulvus]
MPTHWIGTGCAGQRNPSRRRAIAGGHRSLRHVMFQAALVAARHNPSLKSSADLLRKAEKPDKASSPLTREGWSPSPTPCARAVRNGPPRRPDRYNC